MNEKDYHICREFKKEIQQSFPIIAIKAFGSRAREESNEFSDLDLFVEVEHLTKEKKKKIRETAWEIGLQYQIIISTLIFTKWEIEDSPLRISPIIKSIQQEGVLI